jgi:hypothetical protein
VLLVLADAGDRLARHLASVAADHAEIVWVTPTDLVLGRWQHRVVSRGSHAHIGSHLYVRDRWWDLQRASATLNRVGWLPASPAAFRSSADREYAAAERHALVLSVIAGLNGVVVNAPSPPSLVGPDLTPAGWLALAASVGLPVRRAILTTDARRHPRPGWSARQWPSLHPLPAGIPPGPRPVVWLAPVFDEHRCWVVGEDVIPGDPMAGRLAADVDLANLACSSGCTLLEVGLARNDEGATVVLDADPTPVDVPGAVVQAVLRVLLGPVVVPG